MYDGPVCYVDGWHHAVVQNDAGEDVPGDRLYLEDDGTFRVAVDGDESWHERKHTAYAVIVPEGGGVGTSLSSEEFGAFQKWIADLRGGGE